jgi:hydroxymethylbilane synthase
LDFHFWRAKRGSARTMGAPMPASLTLATRRSKLALAQSRAFARELAAKVPGLSITELEIVTSGDKTQDRPLQDIGGKGLFIKELEEALLDGRADFAVHSIKDVPGELAPELVIACIPLREDPRDALVSRSGARLAELPAGARIGTSSLRRAVALRAARPDVTVLPVRGNVDTRLRKMEEGEFDAIVLAFAGLRRLSLGARATEVLAPETCLPAVGQGALGIECRVADAAVRAALAMLADPEATICVEAERALMLAVEGSCKTPVAAFAERKDDVLLVRGMLADPDGSNVRFGERRASFAGGAAEAVRAGRELGLELKR